jgi:flagellar basal body-associated protein FliL
MAPNCNTGVIIAALAMVTLVAIVGIVAMVIVKTHSPTASEQAPCQPVCMAAKPSQKPPAVCKAPLP